MGGDVGADPVMVAVLAAVLDDPHPALAGLEVLPHLLEHLWRHVRVTYKVVGTTDKFCLTEAAHGGEFGIAVSDLTGGIGCGNKALIRQLSC